jgi:hypothetical protein
MDKTARKYGSFKEMKADEYRYWQSRPVDERMKAVKEITLAAYKLKGIIPDTQLDRQIVFRLQRTQS